MTEEECIELICMGGKAADVGLRAFYREMGPPMLRFFALNGAPGDEAKDVLQETVVRVFRAASSYSGNGSGRSWFWQIARNCLTDHHRKLRRVREREVVFDDDGWGRLLESTPAPAQTIVEQDSLEDCISRGVNVYGQQMPDRAYVLTLQMEGAGIDEIAAQIGRSIAATKEYLSQCRKKLRPFISDCLQLLPV
jgi:RNA polymerase sigma factor (sigma-70 family)